MSIFTKKEKRKTESFAPIFQWAAALSGLQKILIIVITFALIAAGFYFFSFKPKLEKLEGLKQTLQKKKRTLKSYKAKAAILPQLEKELAKLKEELNYAMAALPDEKEIPILLTELSRAAKNSGLEFMRFVPGTKQIKENFYAIIPIDMNITGRYHQLAYFFDEVSKFYRIVNINNFNMKKAGKDDQLQVSCKAETYMFVDQKPEKKGKK